METPVTRYTVGDPPIQRAAAATVNLTNRAAWTAILDTLAEANVPPTRQGQARIAVWAARKRLRQRRGQ